MKIANEKKSLIEIEIEIELYEIIIVGVPKKNHKKNLYG